MGYVGTQLSLFKRLKELKALMLNDTNTELIGPNGPIGIPMLLGRGANLVRTADGTAGDTVASDLVSVPIPGGLLGSNGSIAVDITFEASTSTADKALVVGINSLALAAPTVVAANTRGAVRVLANMAGVDNVIESLNNGFNPYVSGTGPILVRNIDMSVDQTLYISLRWTAAATEGNFFRIMGYTVTAYPGTIV